MFSQNTITRIQKQSNNALQTFHKVVNDLTSNDKVINKVQKFLSDED